MQVPLSERYFFVVDILPFYPEEAIRPVKCLPPPTPPVLGPPFGLEVLSKEENRSFRVQFLDFSTEEGRSVIDGTTDRHTGSVSCKVSRPVVRTPVVGNLCENIGGDFSYRPWLSYTEQDSCLKRRSIKRSNVFFTNTSHVDGCDANEISTHGVTLYEFL